MSAVLTIEHKVTVNLEDDWIRNMVASAANVVPPVWPLKTIIACNPLQGFEELPFEQAVIKAQSYLRIDSEHEKAVLVINREMIKWLTAFLDEGQSTITMPNRQQGFYRAFVALAPLDRVLCREQTPYLKQLPQTPEQAIVDSLQRLNIPISEHEEFIRQQLAALPGWSGYVKWRDQWQDREAGERNPINFIEYVAVRLIITSILWPQAKVMSDVTDVSPTFLNAMLAKEATYRRMLLNQLLPEAKRIGNVDSQRADAQCVFCIDVRSEPFRLRLEATGHYQTLGFAGFFGLPVKIRRYDAGKAYDSCPVLVKSRHEVCEHAVEKNQSVLYQHKRGRALFRMLKSLYQALKYHFVTPFALVEMLGPWLGLRMFARTYLPRWVNTLNSSFIQKLMPAIETAPLLDGMSIEEQANYAEMALRMMGLTDTIAPLVMFCGHRGATENNAYAAALDCGACGGNRGGPNAQMLAAILNNPLVRSHLAARRLMIPNDTIFLAAEHDTTTDQVTIYHQEHIPRTHQDVLQKLQSALKQAREANVLTRCKALSANNTNYVNETLERSVDWAQPRPEWGLARNAAFIVGPRELTKNINLQGRCFLHSYDWMRDQDGQFLQVILTAPMVVAQWINNQYLFSTVNNVAYGGGSKVTNNVVGKIGVMQGNASDLMHGLPLQSVYVHDDQPYHEPLRLLTVVYAPKETISMLIERHRILQTLFGNGWVNLVCIDPLDNASYLLQRNLSWQIAR